MTANYRYLTGALLLLSAGCTATSHLTVKVDVYADDPLVASLANPDRLAAIQLAIEKAGPLASEIARTRKELMSQYVHLYQSYLRLLHTIDSRVGADLEGAVAEMAEPQGLYDAELDKRVGTVTKRSEEALNALSSFIPIASSFREGKADFSLSDFFGAWKKLREAQADLQAAMEKVTERNLGTTFEKIADSIAQKVPAGVNAAVAKVIAAALPEDSQKEFQKQITDFDAQLGKLDALAKRITAQSDRAMAQLTESSQLIERAAESSDPGLIGKGIKDAMDAAHAVSAGPGPNLTPQAQAVIGQIGSSWDFMNTQIDRLQDPADPAWRFLSKPENQTRWQTYYAETGFSAEGKTDVVFVRDRLGHFRLQRGKNNPAALIQGQFKITGAIASGLVDVLAATAGAAGIPGVATGIPKIIPPSGIPPEQKEPQKQEATASGVDTSRDARKQQRIESSARLRRQLLLRLEEMQKEMDEVPAGEELPRELLENLRSTLRGFQELIQSTRQEDA
ncbi:MAG: hypothetical protein JW955_19145 [Sedimentisphaerales bacterium]|nr:hypothetical protein [Sedimentisphaerales bacterium]